MSINTTKRILATVGVTLMLGSTMIVTACLLLAVYGWQTGWFDLPDRNNAGDTEYIAQKNTTDDPVYKQYEEVSNYRDIVEQAWQDKEYDGLPLEIYDPGLLEKVVVALEMMSEEAPYEYNYIIESTERIVQAKRTYASNGVTYLRPHDLAASVLLTASTLYHEATHHNQKSSTPRAERELEAIGNEINLMRELEAPKQWIRWLGQQDGEHGDVDGDGKRTISDFFMQDW